MKCDNCGSDCVLVEGTLQETDPCIGEYVVTDAKYHECISCNERFYPLETARRLDSKRREVLSNLIRKRPIGDFMSVTETADALGMSRQALHKHRRIRKGFIFQTEFSGKKVYLRQSVERFKKVGDGRFPLVSAAYSEGLLKYVTHTLSNTPLPKGLCDVPDLARWSPPAMDIAMMPLFRRPGEKPEFAYPLLPSQPTIVVRDREDVKYAYD